MTNLCPDHNERRNPFSSIFGLSKNRGQISQDQGGRSSHMSPLWDGSNRPSVYCRGKYENNYRNCIAGLARLFVAICSACLRGRRGGQCRPRVVDRYARNIYNVGSVFWEVANGRRNVVPEVVSGINLRLEGVHLRDRQRRNR